MDQPTDLVLANLDFLRDFLREERAGTQDADRQVVLDGHLATVDDASERIIALQEELKQCSPTSSPRTSAALSDGGS